MSKPKLPDKSVRVTAKWDDPSEIPIEFADQVHLSRLGDRFYVTLGVTNFPLIEGEVRDHMEVPIKPLHRYAITLADLKRIAGAINSTLPGDEE